METSQPLLLCLFMWLIRHHLKFLLLLLILEILIMYRYQDHCYQIYMISGSLNLHTRPRILTQKSLPQYFYKLVFIFFFIISFVFIPYHVVQNVYSWCPLKHRILVKGFAISYTLLKTSSSMGNSTQLSLWIYFPTYSDMKKCPLSSFNYLKAIPGMLILFNVFVVPVYTMA